MRASLWLLLVIAAAVAGYLAGARGGEGPGTRAAPRPAPSHVPPAVEMPPAPSEGTDVTDVRGGGRGEPAGAIPRDVATRAERIRREHLALADAAEEIAAREIAEEIRREQAFLEDKARGGTMELLRNLDTRLTDLVADEKRFAVLFERHTAGPVLNAGPERGETLPDGATISFPAGVHELELPRSRRFPRDLVVEGAGMDATLVRFAELSANDEVQSLTFRDMTLACGSYFTDLRSKPAAIRLERCRVVGFDKGAGSSLLIGARQVAFYATDCRFESGYGRSPGSGNLFRFQAGLVRLDRCVIQGPFRSIYDGGGAATYLFLRCDIRDAPAQEERAFTSPPDGVRFVDCTFTYLPQGAVVRSKPRPLSDLNPDWPSR
jgi:hypothetical protein